MARKARVKKGAKGGDGAKEIAKTAFLEHAHVEKVWVDEAKGEFYLHAPNEKREGFVCVSREEVDLTEAEETTTA